MCLNVFDVSCCVSGVGTTTVTTDNWSVADFLSFSCRVISRALYSPQCEAIGLWTVINPLVYKTLGGARTLICLNKYLDKNKLFISNMSFKFGGWTSIARYIGYGFPRVPKRWSCLSWKSKKVSAVYICASIVSVRTALLTIVRKAFCVSRKCLTFCWRTFMLLFVVDFLEILEMLRYSHV